MIALLMEIPKRMMRAMMPFIFRAWLKRARNMKAPEKAGGSESINRNGRRKDSN
jgi:hypothetical protein